MVGDFLKKFRSSGYSGKGKEEKPGDGKDEPFSNDEPNETPRFISLTDDEKKSFAGSHPGEDLACEVHGTLEEDGHFHIMSVSPLNKQEGYGSEEEMAGQVAQRVTPTVQLSPS